MEQVHKKNGPWSKNMSGVGGKMVKLSLAVACLFPLSLRSARAQITAGCLQHLDFGSFATAGGSAKIEITPGGAYNPAINIVTLAPGTPGICKVSRVTGTTGTLQLKMAVTKVNITRAAQSILINDFNIITKNAGRTKSLTNASLTAATVTFKIGATLNTVPVESTGAYTGQIIINTTYTN